MAHCIILASPACLARGAAHRLVGVVTSIVVRWVAFGTAAVNTLLWAALPIPITTTAGQRIVIDAIIRLITYRRCLIAA